MVRIIGFFRPAPSAKPQEAKRQETRHLVQTL
jgi:hypothetical protein